MMIEDRVIISGEMESSRTKLRYANINKDTDKSEIKALLKKVKRFLKKIR